MTSTQAINKFYDENAPLLDCEHIDKAIPGQSFDCGRRRMTCIGYVAGILYNSAGFEIEWLFALDDLEHTGRTEAELYATLAEAEERYRRSGSSNPKVIRPYFYETRIPDRALNR